MSSTAQTASIIRFKELPHKPFGPCEGCGDRPATVHAISSLNKMERGTFICTRCVPLSATEIPRDADLFAA